MFTDAPQEGYFLIYLFFDRFFFSFLEEEMINYRTNTVYDSHSFHQKRFSLLNTVVAKKKKKWHTFIWRYTSVLSIHYTGGKCINALNTWSNNFKKIISTSFKKKQETFLSLGIHSFMYSLVFSCTEQFSVFFLNYYCYFSFRAE